MTARSADPATSLLPQRFAAWFAARGWSPRAHQLELLQAVLSGQSALLIAPTGAGKTLAGFLPSLVELTGSNPQAGLHTLYISPLKALAVDVARNLEMPVAQMALGLRIETRSGDTSAAKKARQRHQPPQMLLTTPEQLALLLASADAALLFASLKTVILDELHALTTSKRGDLLSLGLARLRTLAPGLRTLGLSATVRDPHELARYLAAPPASLITAAPGAAPILDILATRACLPWAGHGAQHALAEVYECIQSARLTLVFVNTRAQAEATFQALWRMNDANLPIALHHGSLDAGQRRKVEAAMAEGRLKAVVCTSTLDLGIDWGDVDLVINMGAPKGASRLMQRTGRANHRLDEASRALLVPSNRFEMLECLAAVAAAKAGEHDTALERCGALDVLAQHIVGTACAGPFNAEALYAEVRQAAPFRNLSRREFDDCLGFAADGGYALKAYERFARIRQRPDGLWRLTHPRYARSHRMNIGTIVEADMLKVRLARGGVQTGAAYTGRIARTGRVLGEIEDYFLETLLPGDTFLFSGEVLALAGIVENEALVRRAAGREPKVPSYNGGKFPLSTHLAARVRRLLADEPGWRHLPEQVGDWLAMQRLASALPQADDLLIETFPRGEKHYLVCYPFEGRLAHQTLGMLLTRRMERAGLRPVGFVANDYALAIWSLEDAGAGVDLAALFAPDMLGDDLDAWLNESALMKRSFRNCAVIAGMIERRFPGKTKNGRQVTISTDLIYDVLHRHQPDHVLLRAARADAATGLLDIARLGVMLKRIEGAIHHMPLAHVSPLAVPIMLEIGREPVYGGAQDVILAEATGSLVAEAMGTN